MPCPRCAAESATPAGWCRACDGDFDTWSRAYAGDLVWEILPAAAIVLVAGVALPALGLSFLIACTGVFAGFGTFYGVHRANQRRRRRQFLLTGGVPRMYALPAGPGGPSPPPIDRDSAGSS